MLRDKDIREPLFEFLESQITKVRIIEEKQIGKTRADVVMITENAIWGIEIKSDADTFTRLERQVKDYNRFFDYNVAAVGCSHAMHIEEHLPDWWGIITIDEEESGTTFYWLRRPQPNPKREKKIKLRNQLSFLWRPELAHIQEVNHLPKYRQKSKDFIVKYLIETIDHEELKKQICQELFERDYTTISRVLEEYRQEHRKPPGKKRKR
ncbi:MAG: sce7726 family protein [Blautia sp.]|nr:sce7726 family protein [Blautia sp.]